MTDEPAKEDSERPAVDSQMRVLASERGGNRITIIPQRCDENVLYGQNPVLKDCSLNLNQVDQLAFGDGIQAVVETLATSQLAITIAPLPRYLNEDGEPVARSSGQESVLVGKPAPRIHLKQLSDSHRFELEDQRDKIIVLDFWATWCGPCIQWMPKLESIIEEFPADQVQLVTVNLAEDAKQIRPVLERLQMDPLVLLDVDGAVAERYQATAIPQTVVIDQQGVVDRVYIGGGSQHEQPLRDAISALLQPASSQVSDEP